MGDRKRPLRHTCVGDGQAPPWRAGRRSGHEQGSLAAVSEPVFVPRRGARDEDDGYVLS
ncbi:carotenoid oxygenase family protein [Streptomyces olivaceoviridis]|uniref:carotenoid oxygenase family protein n=1 Tax=Streptomyces olivaceoviridis TaxID=1921 RepID=UPI0033DE29F6